MLTKILNQIVMGMAVMGITALVSVQADPPTNCEECNAQIDEARTAVQTLNQHCWELEAQLEALRAVCKTQITSQTPPVGGTWAQKCDTVHNGTYLPLLQERQACRDQTAVLVKELNKTKHCYYQLQCNTCSSVVGTWSGLGDVGCDGTPDFTDTLTFQADHTCIYPGTPCEWTQTECHVQFQFPGIGYNCTMDSEGDSTMSCQDNVGAGICWSPSRVDNPVSIDINREPGELIPNN